MPKQEAAFAFNDIDKETALAISYQAFKELNWHVLFADDERLVAETDSGWKSNPQHVIILHTGNELKVSSEMIKNELVDIAGRNKKNINRFIKAFEETKNSIQPGNIEANKQILDELRTASKAALEQDIKEAEEIDKAMNLSGSNLYFTYAIIAINVLIFILMAANGAGIFDANGYVHIKWGSNYGPLTLTGDWWRLVTNIFIHFGIIHIAMNMYCLYVVGVYLEPMLGKTKYIAAYLCTGILASLTSLWWHKEGVNSAGASGAIFGLYGLFLALLTTNLIPKKVRNAQLQSIGIFVAYNLIYGMKGGVDNSAHIGGLLSGFVIGYLYAISIKKERQEQKAAWVLPAVLILTIGITAGYLNQHKGEEGQRVAVLNEIKATDYKDNEKFNNKLNEFAGLEEQAIAPFKENLTDEQLEKRLTENALPLWNQAETICMQMQTLDISPEMHKKADALVEYISLRKKEIEVITDIVVNKSVIGEHKLENVRKKMGEVIESMK